MSEFSTFLYARPSFLEGAGRVIDFGNNLAEYNTSLTSEQADRIALEMDWKAIGEELRAAMNQYAKSAR